MVIVNKYIKVMVGRNFLIVSLMLYKCAITKICSVATITLITYDHNRNQKIPPHHDLDIIIYYYHVQYGLEISCFAIAIPILVDSHVSRDIVHMCMSPTLYNLREPFRTSRAVGTTILILSKAGAGPVTLCSNFKASTYIVLHL